MRPEIHKPETFSISVIKTVNAASGRLQGTCANGKLAACLVLRELAKEAPSWVHLRMSEIIPQIVVAVHDRQEQVNAKRLLLRGYAHGEQ